MDGRLNDDGATELAWAECDNLGISLRSHRYSADELASMAEDLRVGADGVELDPGSDGGLEEVLRTPTVEWLFEADFDHPRSRQVRVQGHDALVYEHPVSPVRFDVFWMESPTIAVIAYGHGTVVEVAEESGITVDPMTEEKILDFVEQLRPATAEEASALAASAGS
jgi:hypothetical protein